MRGLAWTWLAESALAVKIAKTFTQTSNYREAHGALRTRGGPPKRANRKFSV